MDKISKEFTVFEIDNIVKYYKGIRENELMKNKFNVFSIATQYSIKKNMDIMTEATASYTEFREEKEKELHDNYFNDEKSFETMVKQVENGEEKEVPGRQIKDEYLDEFKKVQTEMLSELYKLASEKVTLELYPINLDEEIQNIDKDTHTKINMDDLDFLSIFK